MDEGWSHPMRLISGIPQVGYANTSHYTYYRLIIEEENVPDYIEIRVTPQFGDPG